MMEFGDMMSYVGVALGSGGLTQLLNWRINRKKGLAEAKTTEAEASNTEAEAKNKEIDNMRKAMEDFYTPLVKRQNERIAELEAEVKQLREEKRAEAEAHAKQLAAMQEQIVEINKALGLRARSAIKERNTTFHKKTP